MPFEVPDKFSFEEKILKNPPIIEAILEIRWDVLEKNRTLIEPIDKKFKFFPGIFYEKIKELYPEVEVLPNSRIPDEMDFYLARYRFRKKPKGYPLVQIGPGILTVNLDKNFSQKIFLSSCLEILNVLFSIMSDIEIIEIRIHYIDGFDFEYENNNPFDFLNEKLHTHFKFAPELFEATKITPIPTGFHLEANYKVRNPSGYFMCQLRSGLRKTDKNKLILMDTIFRTSRNNIPSREKIPDWILEADNLIHTWFYKMIESIKELFE